MTLRSRLPEARDWPPMPQVVQPDGRKSALMEQEVEGPGQDVGGHRAAALGGEDVAAAVFAEQGEFGLLKVLVAA